MAHTLPRFTEADLQHLTTLYPTIASAIYSSVGPRAERVVDMLEAYIPRVLELGADVPVPIEVLYDRSTLGSDRLAAAVGAYALETGARELLVIDAGTAITYERISSSGTYLGGNISPGLHARLRAMHEFTSRLPLIEEVEESEGFGQSTRSAMQRGALMGLLYEVEGYIAHLRAIDPEARVLLTGGDAEQLCSHLGCQVEIVADLVLHGLNYILEYNKQC